MHTRSVDTLFCRAIRFAVAGLLTLLPLGETHAQQFPGEVLQSSKINAISGGFTGPLVDGDGLGSACTGLGDVDGDGVTDIAVGASQEGFSIGAVYVLLMNANGTVKAEQKITEGVGGFTGDLDDFDAFGGSVAGLPDMDGDGVPELAVGADSDDDSSGGPAFPSKGAVWILFLNSNGTVKSHQKISDTQGGLPFTLDFGPRFGHALAHAGDVDDDGVPDLWVGAVNWGPMGAGAVFLLRLNANGTVKSHVEISEDTTFGGTIDTTDSFGSAVAGIPDLDGDGVDELAVGAAGDAFLFLNTGAVWIVFLNADGTVKSEQKVNAEQGGFQGPIEEEWRFGTSVASIGDLDGDGLGEIVVGSPTEGEGAPTFFQPGAVWVLFLNANGTVKAQQKISHNTGGFGALADSWGFGQSVGPVGDFNGDGVPDVLVGQPYNEETLGDGTGSYGAFYILSLVGPSITNPYELPTGVFRGRGGRTTVVLPGPGPKDDAIDDPIVVVPKFEGSEIGVLQVTGALDGAMEVSFVDEFPTGEAPVHAASADFDGDGNNDLVVANSQGGVGGTGSFSYLAADPTPGQPIFSAQVEFDLPMGGTPVAIATGDFDGDTNPDVAVAGDGGVSIFLGDGFGGFSFESFTAVADVNDLAVGLVDGDGDLDVITASGAVAAGPGFESGTASVLIGDGTGSLSVMGTFASGQALASVLLLDVDGGGTLDALLAQHEFDGGRSGEPQGTLLLYNGDGLGGFTASGSFTGFSTPSELGSHPTWGAVGDLDGDTFPDAVYTNNENISHPAGTFADVEPDLVLTVLDNDQAGGFAVTEIGTAYSGEGVAPVLVDVTGGAGPAPDFTDGALDAVVVWSSDAFAGQGGLQGSGEATFAAGFANDGSGNLEDATIGYYAVGASPGDGDVGDIDGDAGDGSPGGLDLVIPNMADNSVSVLLGDGSGAFPDPPIVVSNVDDTVGGSLPTGAGQIWVGGPRSAQLGDLNGDGDPDLVVANAWFDTQAVPVADVFASVSLFTGDGTGNFTKTQFTSLPRSGDLALAEVTGDANLDVIVTFVRGTSGGSRAVVLIGQGDGTTSGSLIPAAPGGTSVSGGLAIADVAGSSDLDLITTSRNNGSGAGSLLVFVNTGGGFTTSTTPMGTTWDAIRSVDVGDVDGDSELDVVIGAPDGRLFLANGTGGGSFTAGAVASVPGALGGGALRLGETNGDGVLDVVSSNAASPTLSDQSMVRTILGLPTGGFALGAVEGLGATGSEGALRPILTDINDDGANDLVAIHGDAGAITVVLNRFSRWVPFGAGKLGTGAITPRLRGRGYTTPGGQIDIVIDNAVGGALGLFQVGVGQVPTGFLHVGTVIFEFIIPLAGTPGAPGAGNLTLSTALPPDGSFTGLPLTMQVLIQDLGAGAPPPFTISATNGLELTIIQ